MTWKGKHLGLYLTPKSRITEMNLDSNFRDKMVDGKFESYQPDPFFIEVNGCTIMKDQILYIVPLIILGKVFDRFVLKKIVNTIDNRKKSIHKKIS